MGKKKRRAFQGRGSTLSAVGQRHLGFLRRADPTVAPGTIGIELHDTAKASFERLLAMPPPTDAWIASHRNQLLETSGEFPGLVQASDFPRFNGYIADVLPLAEDNYWALVGMAGALVPQNTGRGLTLYGLSNGKEVTGRTIPKSVGSSSLDPRSSRGQALRKQVSTSWIPRACSGSDPGFAGMTTGWDLQVWDSRSFPAPDSIRG